MSPFAYDCLLGILLRFIFAKKRIATVKKQRHRERQLETIELGEGIT